MSEVTTANAHRFYVGAAITVTPYHRWYTRLWRWITRYKEPVINSLIVTKIDYDTGTITVSSWPICNCGSDSNLHPRSCAAVQSWLESFGYDGSYPLPAVIDLSDTRYGR